MQAPRLSLLRLGRELQRHEVRYFPTPARVSLATGISNISCSAFLQSNLLPAFSKSHPQIEIRVSPRPHKHPVIRGHYINGREKAICVRNLEKEQVLQKVELLMQASGEKNKKIRGKNVLSSNESVRGIWSPYHGGIKNV